MKIGILFFAAVSFSFGAQDVLTLRLDPAPGMSRAELQYLQPSDTPLAVLVLCPGYNGNGAKLIGDPEWRDFAKKHRLGLVGLSFTSPPEAIRDGTGYYYVAKGSGEKLLEGIRAIFGRDLPLLVYGTSGGAHFTSRFEQWRPDRVLAWCAYSAEWWDEPKKQSLSPPGIVACGERDSSRYGASLLYFKRGRATGLPWLWISLADTGHEPSPELDDFVRGYFATMLNGSLRKPSIVDIDEETIVTGDDFSAVLSAFLPSIDLLEPWQDVHSP